MIFPWAKRRSVILGTPSTETQTFYGALKHIAEGLINRYPNKLIIFLTPPHGSSDAVPEYLAWGRICQCRA
ncbi:hypothetical protein [Paenibacillus kribbensis]|uniref:hypothetical protein n=1 Tax=Paenibacillus kribbensis TaxID=172713 RepID=UPI0021183780|nr:hypothetical protein [Paenibacillus kribbensis]